LPAGHANRGPPRHPHEPFGDLRPQLSHRPEPSAPIDRQAVAIDAQHATFDLGGTVGRRAEVAQGDSLDIEASQPNNHVGACPHPLSLCKDLVAENPRPAGQW
jgi:hypothetical protein